MARAWRLPQLPGSHTLASLTVFLVCQARATYYPLKVLCEFLDVKGWEEGLEILISGTPAAQALMISKAFHLDVSWEDGIRQKRLRELAALIGVLQRQGMESAMEVFVQKVIQDLQEKKYAITTFLDETYPESLRTLADPPPVLWLNQTLPPLTDVLIVAIIGSRQMSFYGSLVTDVITSGLVNGWNYMIVSGCAPGVDSQAHLQALRCGGKTIGVLACGIDQVSPRVKRVFSSERAYLVTEFPPGTSSDKWQFRYRNRLISGLAQGVIVVEAGSASGTMITAHAAAEQGREVMVVPQSIFGKNIAGVMELQHEGATFITSAWDAHQALTTEGSSSPQPVLPFEPWRRLVETPVEKAIVEGVLAWQGQVLAEVLWNQLGQRKEVSLPEWRTALFQLEQRGVLRQNVGVLTLSRMIQS